MTTGVRNAFLFISSSVDAAGHQDSLRPAGHQGRHDKGDDSPHELEQYSPQHLGLGAAAVAFAWRGRVVMRARGVCERERDDALRAICSSPGGGCCCCLHIVALIAARLRRSQKTKREEAIDLGSTPAPL